jgi:hypothetical protein
VNSFFKISIYGVLGVAVGKPGKLGCVPVGDVTATQLCADVGLVTTFRRLLTYADVC